MLRLIYSLLALLLLFPTTAWCQEEQLLSREQLLELYGDSTDELNETEANALLLDLVNHEREQAGLPGDHHFFITFDTTAPGVRLSKRMRERYPESMAIVIQHTYWNLVASETGFDLVLTDIQMPLMDGIEMSHSIARAQSGQKILMMTGYANQRERAENLSNVIIDVVQKPFTLPEIRKRVSEALAA